MTANPKIQFQWLLVTVGVLLMTGKFIAFWLTGSNLLLSDALESLVNIATGSFGLYSLYLAAKPRDADHPYGHGKIEFISAGLEGGLIMLAGIGIAAKSVYNLFYPEPLQQLDIGIAIAGLAGGINFLLGFFAERTGRNHNSVTLIAGGKHLKTDAYTTVAMIGGLALVLWTNRVWIDSAAALLLSVLIMYSGIRIVRHSVGGIMDEADFSLLEDVVRHLSANREENWIDIHNLRIIRYGDSIHIDCHITLPWYYTVEEGHDEIEKVEALINEKLPNNLESFIHIDPCVEASCALCRIADCKVRKAPFRDTVPWTMKNVMRNEKHSRSMLPHVTEGE